MTLLLYLEARRCGSMSFSEQFGFLGACLIRDRSEENNPAFPFLSVPMIFYRCGDTSELAQVGNLSDSLHSHTTINRVNSSDTTQHTTKQYQSLSFQTMHNCQACCCLNTQNFLIPAGSSVVWKVSLFQSPQLSQFMCNAWMSIHAAPVVQLTCPFKILHWVGCAPHSALLLKCSSFIWL